MLQLSGNKNRHQTESVHRILYINHFTAIYGSEISLFELVTHLDESRFHPLVVLPDEGPLTQKIRDSGVRVIVAPLQSLKTNNPLPYLKTALNLFRIIKRERADLVHANCDLSGQYGIVAGRLAGVPTVCSTRNILGPRAFKRSFLGWADALVANSRATASNYQPNRKQRRYIVYNAVDVTKFTPIGRYEQLRHQWGLDDKTFVIALIGRITPEKGQNTFLEAFSQIVAKKPKTHAFLVGSTEVDRSEDFLITLKQMVQSLGLSDKVTFLDAVESVPALLEMIDLLVCPSVAEPFGRVLIEAMAMAKPVVATDSGGPLEIVVEGKTGLLVPYGNPEALAGAILRLMDDPQLASEFGANGRQRAEDQFSIEKNVRVTEQVYISLLSNSQDKREERGVDVGKK